MPVLVKTMGSVRDRVDRGVELLDAEVPDWRDRVHPTHLDLSNCSTCLLGQVFDEGPFAVQSGYHIGQRVLGISGAVRTDRGLASEASWYGFMATHGELSYAPLRAEWLRRLS